MDDVQEFRRQLDAVLVQIRTAQGGFEISLLSVPDPADVDKESVEYLIRKAYISLIAFLGAHGLSEANEYLQTEWTKSADDLLAPKQSASLGTYLPALTLLSDIADSLGETFGQRTDIKTASISLEVLIKSIPLAATRLGIKIGSEVTLHKVAEAVFLSAFPDTETKPTIQAAGVRTEPDSRIKSIRTLIEYKFISAKKRRTEVLRGMQEDIRQYGYDKSSKHLIFIIFQTSRIITEAQIDNTVQPPYDFETVDAILVGP